MYKNYTDIGFIAHKIGASRLLFPLMVERNLPTSLNSYTRKL